MRRYDVIHGNTEMIGIRAKNEEDLKRVLNEEKGLSEKGIASCTVRERKGEWLVITKYEGASHVERLHTKGEARQYFKEEKAAILAMSQSAKVYLVHIEEETDLEGGVEYDIR